MGGEVMDLSDRVDVISTYVDCFDEINKLLDQEILLALEKLRKEQMQYMQWSNGNTELDRLIVKGIAVNGLGKDKCKNNGKQGKSGQNRHENRKSREKPEAEAV
ncbi:hypothetical protein Tco_1030514 [Tanacetum coccineum]|uniref:Uncharacterized protein n=1 Tax=Tanacetum coccineum TaxID=301880 RepID=A0ABQ5G810_9ASTR